MARNCSICGKKIGLLEDGGFLGRNKNILACDSCFIFAQKLHISEKDDVSELYESRRFFNKCIQAGTVSPEVVEELNVLLSESTTAEENNMKYRNRKKLFKTTTGYNFEGYSIIDYKNIVTDEVVLGTGFLSELSGQVNDFLGTSSGTFEGKMSKAKKIALNNLIEKSLSIGANALIGIDFDIMTLTNNMIVVSINATAVVIEKIKRSL